VRLSQAPHPSISTWEIPVAASTTRLDTDLVRRLDLLNASCDPLPEWLAPARGALVESVFWLVVAALLWVVALIFL
jgi:hypothetical protein